MLKPIKKMDKNGDVVYKLRVFVGRDENNKVKIVSRTWKPDPKWSKPRIEKELVLAISKFQEEIDEQTEKVTKENRTIISNKNRITFEEFSDIFIEDYAKVALKTRTYRDYEGRLKRIKPAIGHINLCDFTPVIINKFLSNLSEPGVKLTVKKGEAPKGLSSKSVKNYKILLSSIFTKAVEWGYIEKTPMIGIVIPRVVSKKIEPLSPEEVKKLIELLRENAPLKYHIFIVLDIITGMRRGELLGLTWDKIDFKKQIITINANLLYTSQDGVYLDSTKTSSSDRAIHISQWLVDLLKAYKKEQQETRERLKESGGNLNWNPDNFVFVRDNGEPIHPNTPYNWFIRFQERNELRVVSIQALRHTTATLLILNQVNTKLVSGRLGHSSTKTTNDIYAEYVKQADEAVNDVLDDIIISNA